MLRHLPFVYTFALLFSLGASPLRALENVETQIQQAQSAVLGFIEKEKRGGSTNDSFLKLDDVKGSSTDSAHQGQITVLFSRNAIVGGASATTPGKAAPSLYYLVIPTDKALPILQQAAASGRPFQRAEIFFRTAVQGEQKEYGVDTLEDVRVVCFLRTATSSPSYPDVVVIGLSFAKATWAQGTTKAGRDFSGNKNY